MSSKWCFKWPHCACGIVKADELIESGQRLLVFRNDVGDLKRVPVSEIRAYAITEVLSRDQFSIDCPQTRDLPAD